MEEQPKKETSEEKYKIRTFKDDLASAVRSGEVTTAKVAVKEQQRRRRLGLDGEKKKLHLSKFFIPLVSFIFIVVAIGVFVTLSINPELSFLNKKVVTNNEETIIPLFENVSKIEISAITSRENTFSTFDSLLLNGEEGKLQVFEFYTKNNSEIPTPSTPQDFFRYIQASPDRLGRSINKIVYGLDGENPFLLMELTSFETTFVGMLNWEDKMTRDLETVFQKIRDFDYNNQPITPDEIENEIPGEVDETLEEEVVEAESSEEMEVSEDVDEPQEEEGESIDEETDESEPEVVIVEEKWNDAKYYDEILFNKDARVLRKNNGDQGIIYTFIDKNYLLISTEVITIKTIIEAVNSYYISNQ